MNRFRDIASFAVAVCLLWIFTAHGSEPVYKEKNLSAWLEEFYSGSAKSREATEANKAAICAMSSNAVPYLIQMVRGEGTDSQKHAKPSLSTEDIKARGLTGVVALGPAAKAAVPEVLVLLTNESKLKPYAAVALGSIGSDAGVAASILAQCIGIWPNPDRESAQYALSQIGTAGSNAVPILSPLLSHKDIDIRELSMISLVAVSPDPASCVPKLIEGLSDSAPSVRRCAANALAKLGKKGEPASAALKKLKDDACPSVRVAATRALERIAGSPAPQVENARNIVFRGVPVYRALMIYQQESGKKVQVESKGITGQQISIVAENVSVKELLSILEDELKAQTQVTLIQNENNTVTAKLPK